MYLNNQPIFAVLHTSQLNSCKHFTGRDKNIQGKSRLTQRPSWLHQDESNSTFFTWLWIEIELRDNLHFNPAFFFYLELVDMIIQKRQISLQNTLRKIPESNTSSAASCIKVNKVLQRWMCHHQVLVRMCSLAQSLSCRSAESLLFQDHNIVYFKKSLTFSPAHQFWLI